MKYVVAAFSAFTRVLSTILAFIILKGFVFETLSLNHNRITKIVDDIDMMQEYDKD